MLKILCCLLAVVACGAIGIFKSEGYKKRVLELCACEALIGKLKAGLLTRQLSTPMLFFEVAKAKSMERLPFVRYCSEGLCDNPDFPYVWRESIERARGEMSLKDDDFVLLLSLCELIGSYDVQGIAMGLDQSRSLLAEAQQEARHEYEQNGKLFRSLGLLGGIAASIMII